MFRNNFQTASQCLPGTPAGGFHYGILRGGVWLALTLDGSGNDYAGKWNS
jgi:hypothetical protein